MGGIGGHSDHLEHHPPQGRIHGVGNGLRVRGFREMIGAVLFKNPGGDQGEELNVETAVHPQTPRPFPVAPRDDQVSLEPLRPSVQIVPGAGTEGRALQVQIGHAETLHHLKCPVFHGGSSFQSRSGKSVI